MIHFVRGKLEETGNDYVVLDNHGIGYLIYTPSSVLNELPNRGETVRMYTYMYVREDQMTLYGFLTRDDLQIFKLLISISGIGPKGALGILSTISPDQFRIAVISGDSKAISKYYDFDTYAQAKECGIDSTDCELCKDLAIEKENYEKRKGENK